MPIPSTPFHQSLKKEKRNIYLGSKRTTLSFEVYVWQALNQISNDEGKSVDEICTEINLRYNGPETLSSVIRYLSQEVIRLREQRLARNGSAMHDEMHEDGLGFPSPYHQVLNSLGEAPSRQPYDRPHQHLKPRPQHQQP